MPSRTIEGIEELKTLIGQEISTSDWLPVTQEMIAAFAGVTQDRQWIHLDVERAKKESPFGTTIAHGFLTLSLISQLHAQSVQIRGEYRLAVNYGLNRVRFTAPVRSGAKIRSRSTLQAMEDIPKGVQITWLINVECEGSTKPALIAEWLVRLYL